MHHSLEAGSKVGKVYGLLNTTLSHFSLNSFPLTKTFSNQPNAYHGFLLQNAICIVESLDVIQYNFKTIMLAPKNCLLKSTPHHRIWWDNRERDSTCRDQQILLLTVTQPFRAQFIKKGNIVVQ